MKDETGKSSSEPKRSAVSAWLRNLLMAALVLLLCVTSLLMYRMAVVVSRLENLVGSVSSDVKSVTSTVSDLSQDISDIRDDLSGLKDKAREAIPYEEARSIIEEAFAIGAAAEGDEAELSDEAEHEIKALLARLMSSGYESQCGDNKQSAATLYARLYGKLKLKKASIGSAEDFIEQVASQSMTGDIYYLLDAEGNEIVLSDWMRGQLAEVRAGSE